MATIQSVIDMVDNINPNTYNNETKTQWINECEGLVQTKVMLLAIDDVVQYRYSAEWKGTGVTFPNDHTMTLPSAHGFKAGDYVTIKGLTTYSGNIKNTAIQVKNADGNSLIFDDDTFDDIGTTPESSNATVFYDGKGTELIAEFPHDKIYYPYVCAMVDYANGEYTRYANEMTMFNARFNEYMAWFATNFDPAGRCDSVEV